MTITDDLRMLQDSGLPQYQDPGENAVRALAAGNTMLLFVLGADPSEDGVDPGTSSTRSSRRCDAGGSRLPRSTRMRCKLLVLRRSLAVGDD